MCLPTMFLSFLVQYFQNKGEFRSLRAHPLQVLGWFPLIGMTLLSLILPSFVPFQIRVEVNSKKIYRCIVDEGASTSILSSSTWQALGSPKLVSEEHELLDFDRCPSEYLGILPQFPISLGGNIVLFNVIVVQGPLDFNMILGHDYVYAMKVVVSTLFWVMHFPHNGRIVTIEQLTSNNNHPNSVLVHASPLYVPSICVDSTLP
jgi:hypothetical protein